VSKLSTSVVAAKAGRSPVAESADLKEKEEAVHAEVTIPDDNLLNDEDEVFEWYEVRRGMSLTSNSYSPYINF